MIPLAADALTIIAVLAQRAGGRLRVDFEEIVDLTVKIERDDAGITAEVVNGAAGEVAVAAPDEAAAAVEHAKRLATRLDELMEGAARQRQMRRFVD